MKLLRSLLGLALVLVPIVSLAATGEDNPTGVSGVFNGNIGTGSSYDPYTGNATRAVTDIVVNGGVGAYPLAFTRYMNSRGAGATPAFGAAGSWTHSYSWSIDPVYYTSTTGYGGPGSYQVRYPDGRSISFSNRGTGDPDFRGPAGVRDRFEKLASGGTECYLRMADGGRIHFHATVNNWTERVEGGCDGCWTTFYHSDYTFVFTDIIDPYGQTTHITYPSAGVMVVTEPAQRTLTITNFTGPAGDSVVRTVASSDGRSITYNYDNTAGNNFGGTIYSCLIGVANYDGTPSIYTYQASNTAANGRPLIKTCIDPMYAGPMWRIGYSFSGTTVYGQLASELYYDGTTYSTSTPVSSLAFGTNTRTETRGDGPSRTFTYTGYKVTGITDFNGAGMSIAYDAAGFPNAVTDFNGNTTNFTNNAFNGAQTAVTYPLTPSDTALGLGRAVSGTTYGYGACPDPNNRDGNNPYYVYNDSNRKRGHGKRGRSATYLRDTSKRVTTINYPDGGTENFTYNAFGQVLSHTLKTGGTESFEYDSRGNLTAYRDAYHLSPGPASVSYTYYASTMGGQADLVNTITINGDATTTTTFNYDSRGHLLSKTIPGSPTAPAVTNTYDQTTGVLLTTSDERQKTTTFTYDDYKRLRTTTLPPPAGGTSPAPTTVAYKRDFTNNPDYTHTDANPWLTISPTGLTTNITYDNNNRKSSVTVAPGNNNDASNDQAITSFTYDNNGNLQTVKDPNNNKTGGSTVTTYYYDQQNRTTDVDDRMVNDATVPHQNANGHTVSYTYDQASNVLTQRRANNQVVTNVYDSMNRLTQTTVPQTPNPNAVTHNTYYASGLLHTMQDPNGNTYTYGYDLMGRKSSLTYPDSTTESWTFDGAGNLGTFVNRSNNTQLFTYDNRERNTGFSWDDGVTPSVAVTYTDTAPRTVRIDSSYPGPGPSPAAQTVTVTDVFNDDGTLRSEAESTSIEGVPARTVQYSYDADLRRTSTTHPGTARVYTNYYTSRGRVWWTDDTTAPATPIRVRTYGYDHNENLVMHFSSDYSTAIWETPINYNAMDMETGATFLLNGWNRNLSYSYDAMNDRTAMTREWGTETYGYDLNEQTTTGPEGTYSYDANGNRSGTGFSVNTLNQYTSFPGTTGLAYDTRGNVQNDGNGGTYSYDAQNRLTSATVGGVTTTFVYDGLNRKFSQTTGSTTTVNVWDGWNLLQEYTYGQTTPLNSYVYGVGGLAERMTSNGTINYYFQDALGSTSHVTDNTGHVVEYYKYDRFGQVTVYDGTTNAIKTSGSTYDVRHLFTGQLWMPQLGLYDMRNRVYSPYAGRFMQPDPIGFRSDRASLYRYVGNRSPNRKDKFGLADQAVPANDNNDDHDTATVETVVVTGASTGTGGPDSPIIIPSSQDPVSFIGSNGPAFYQSNGVVGNFSGEDDPAFDSQRNEAKFFNRAKLNPSGTHFDFTLGLTVMNMFVDPFTFYVGANITIAPLAGATFSVGAYIAPDRIGLYYSTGTAEGLDVSASITEGVVKGTSANFKGPFHNASFASVAKTGYTGMYNSNNEFAGGALSLGLGYQLASITYTDTGDIYGWDR